MKKSAGFLIMLTLVICSLSLKQLSAQTYCASTGTCGTSFDYVTNVSLSGLNNASACSNYSDYTVAVAPASLNIGLASTLTLTRFNPGGVNVFAAVWIDWNHNGDFEDDPAEKVGTFAGINNYTTSVTPPAGAYIGTTRMRVRIQGSTPPTSSCGAGGYEVEDYAVTVSAVCPIDFSVTAPYTSPVSTTVGAGMNCSFSSAEDHVYAITIPCQSDWTFSVCNTSTNYDTEIHLGTSCCSNNLGSNNDNCGTASSITQTNLAAGIYYLTVEGNAAAAGNYVLSVTSSVVCYCAATNTDCGFEYITNFTLAGINNNSGCDAPYDDFTNLVANMTMGQTYNGTATKNDVLPNYNLAVWGDWNHNGVFEETERSAASLSGTSNYTFVISPPTTALPGATRIRTRMVQNSVPNSCGVFDRGDIEDYTAFLTAPLPGCAINNAPANNATNACRNTTLSWSAPPTGSVPTGYKVYFGTTTMPSLVSTQPGTTYNPGALMASTQYYWKIVPYNASGDATGCGELTFTTTNLAALIAPDPATVCAGGTLPMNGGPTGGGTYTGHSWTGAGSAKLSNTITQNPTFTATVAGNDTLIYTVTDVNGCTAKDSVIVVVNPTTAASVTIAVTAGTNPSCSGAPVTFTATPVNGGSTPAYQWKVNGSNVGTGSTFNSSTLADNDIVTAVLTSSSTCASPAMDTSNAITMSVSAALVADVSIAITSGTNPTCDGTSITFTASPANGGTAPAYQWKVNGSNTGTNSDIFSSTTLADNDIVTAVMSTSSACASPASVTSNGITMTVNPNPVPVITQSGSMLSSSETSGNQWYMNGSIMTGETNQDLNLTQNGTYSVTVTDAFNCTGTSADFIVTSIGIEQTENIFSLNVYPNPLQNSTVISYILTQAANVSIEILNTIGQHVYGIQNENQKAGKYEITIDVQKSGLSEGIYFVKFETEEKIQVLKIVVLK
jgi:hypothetical protein